MFECQSRLIGLRGFIVAVGLALLAGCLPHTNNPAAPVPTDLVATAGNAEVTLTWTASAGATGYNVKRATSAAGPFTLIAAPTATTYADNTVTNGTTYYYVVSSLNPGESINSAAVSATPEEAAPVAPTDVVATAGNASVALTWTASTGATSYNVKRSTTSGGPYTTIASPTSPSYTDATVTNGTTYFYVVSAVNAAGESANSAQVSALPQPAPTVPAAPTNVVATAGNATVALTWTASAGATSYNVKRATTSGGPYTQIASPTSASYNDATVTNGTTYFYVVSAVNSAGESANSTQVSALPQAATTAPVAPANVAAVAGDAQVSLTWTASAGATSYHVKRATTNGGPYTQIGAPTAAAYVDTGLTNGTTYYYVVSALNAGGESANSAQVSAVPNTVTPPPTNFGTWIDVTPSNASLAMTYSCGNYGSVTVQADPAQPSNLYTEFNCQGIWKSTDYGLTWTGPINTGTNGAAVGDCSGGVSISPTSTAIPATIYEACIRGTGTGFWKSVDGGVNWTNYVVAATTRQDYYPPVIDPYDQNHLLMTGHEFDSIVESVDGGQNWTSVPLNSGMLQTNLTGFIFFVNTGVASTTRGTWLWEGQGSGGKYGTWRTTNSGTVWVQVDKNEHTGGAAQVYQPGTNGVYYIAGDYSALGTGVLRSSDYGETWTHVGQNNDAETVVFGTSKNVYGMYGYPMATNTAFEIASQPGTGTWVTQSTPTGLYGPAQVAVVNDGTHNILVGGMWTSGVWRYIEP